MKFRDVILKYYKMVYHISLEYLRRKEDAEDIVQEVFFKYAKYINEEKKTFEDELHEKYWIIRITINSCCNYLKDPKRKKDLEDYFMQLLMSDGQEIMNIMQEQNGVVLGNKMVER